MRRIARVTRSSKSTKVQIAIIVPPLSARISGMIAILPINRLVVGICARAGTLGGIEEEKNGIWVKECFSSLER